MHNEACEFVFILFNLHKIKLVNDAKLKCWVTYFINWLMHMQTCEFVFFTQNKIGE